MMLLKEYLALFEGMDPELPVFEESDGYLAPVYGSKPAVAWVWPTGSLTAPTGTYDSHYDEMEAPRKSIKAVIL